MAESKFKRLYRELDEYSRMNLKDYIKDRLDSTLKNYIYDIDLACSRIKDRKPEKIFRGLSK